MEIEGRLFGSGKGYRERRTREDNEVNMIKLCHMYVCVYIYENVIVKPIILYNINIRSRPFYLAKVT
jgi:hypothetical protein